MPFQNLIRLTSIVAALAGGLALSTSASNADDLQIRIGGNNGYIAFGIEDKGVHRVHDRRGHRHAHRRDRHRHSHKHRGRHGRKHHGNPYGVWWCPPEYAIEKAWSMGVNRPHIKRIIDDRIVVVGRKRGHRAKVVYDRYSSSCKVIKTRGLYHY